MLYPSKDDYLKAVQDSESFTTGVLRQAQFDVHPRWGIPTPAAGASAVVFKAEVEGEPQALRFFTREDVSTRAHYEALQVHFTGHGLASCVATSSWVENGIWVNAQTWPVLRMQWVNGRTLNQYVDHLVERRDTQALGCLAATWRELVGRLQQAEFSHGDLQHGNVLIDEKSALRLVDFDCSWIPAFAGRRAPNENGHPNFQTENRLWGRWMDTFPGLVIYVALLALSKDPEHWDRYNTNENLLFESRDFRPPFDTPVWTYVSSTADPHLDQLVAQLKTCCEPGWSATCGLEELLAPATVPWWDLARNAAAGQASVLGEPAPTAGSLPPPPPVSVPGPRSEPVSVAASDPSRVWWPASSTAAPETDEPVASPSLWLRAGVAVSTGVLTTAGASALVDATGGDPAVGAVAGALTGLFAWAKMRPKSAGRT